jgi:glutamate carboxypeptidase
MAAGLEALAARSENMIARTESWSAINSGSREPAGLARMADAIAPVLAALPGQVEQLALPASPFVRADGTLGATEHGCALRLKVRPEAPIQVALTGHFDTVFPAASPFQTPQRLPDGTLHGPGVADMKGGLVVMLEALAAFETHRPNDHLGFEVLLSPDEEIGSPASAALLAELGARAQFGMIYEPALPDGAVVDVRKGSGNFSLIMKGRAAHVGRAFQDGRSAIVAAADAVLRLDALNGQRDGVTFNTGAVDGGAPVNMVPDGAVVRFNVRMPDVGAQAWALAEIARVVETIAARDGITVQLHGGVTRAPKPLNRAQAAAIGWVRAAGGDLGLALAFKPSGGVCEGNNLAAAGCPNIDTLGPIGSGLHSSDEMAVMASFAERAQLSFLLLHGLASGRFQVAELMA